MSFGLKVKSSPLVNKGTFIWTRGSEVIGVSTADRRKFLGMFGLMPEAPSGADGVVTSEDDYILISEAAQPHNGEQGS